MAVAGSEHSRRPPADTPGTYLKIPGMDRDATRLDLFALVCVALALAVCWYWPRNDDPGLAPGFRLRGEQKGRSGFVCFSDLR
jgi:hypothetical protein